MEEGRATGSVYIVRSIWLLPFNLDQVLSGCQWNKVMLDRWVNKTKIFKTLWIQLNTSDFLNRLKFSFTPKHPNPLHLLTHPYNFPFWWSLTLLVSFDMLSILKLLIYWRCNSEQVVKIFSSNNVGVISGDEQVSILKQLQFHFLMLHFKKPMHYLLTCL